MRKISRHQLSTNSLLNWALQGKHGNGLSEHFHASMFANHLKNSYEIISDSTQVRAEKSVKLDEFSKKTYAGSCFENAIEIKKTLSECNFFDSFFLHGSTSDFAAIDGWSDFDSIAVINDNVFHNFEKSLSICKKLDVLMRKTDEYQHHGIHFVHRCELQNWPQLYLPTNLFEDFICLLETNDIQFTEVNSIEQELARFKGIARTFEDAAQSGILKHHAKDGIYLEENYKNVHTMYQMKYLLSVVMLLPSLWLNLNGINCRKSDSFEIIKEYFSVDELELISCASEIRREWKPEYNMENNEIPQFLKSILGFNYFERASSLIKTMVSKIEIDSTRI